MKPCEQFGEKGHDLSCCRVCSVYLRNKAYQKVEPPVKDNLAYFLAIVIPIAYLFLGAFI